MNPAPPVTSTSTIVAGPVVRQRAMRIEAVFVRLTVVVGLGGNVEHGRHLRADALPAVIDERWNLDEEAVLGADEKLVDGVARRRAVTGVDEHELDHPR